MTATQFVLQSSFWMLSSYHQQCADGRKLPALDGTPRYTRSQEAHHVPSSTTLTVICVMLIV